MTNGSNKDIGHVIKKVFSCSTKFSSLQNMYEGLYRGIFVMRDWLILFSVKREFKKLFFVTRDLKVLRDP